MKRSECNSNRFLKKKKEQACEKKEGEEEEQDGKTEGR